MIHIKDNLFIRIDQEKALFLTLYDIDFLLLFDKSGNTFKYDKSMKTLPEGTIIKMAEHPTYDKVCQCPHHNHLNILTDNIDTLISLVVEATREADVILGYSLLKYEDLVITKIVSAEEVKTAEEDLNVEDMSSILKNRGIKFDD